MTMPRGSKRSPCFSGGTAGQLAAMEAYAASQGEKTLVRGYNTFIVLSSANVAEFLFAEDADRAFFEIQNRGPGNIYVSIGQLPQAPALNYPGAIWIQPNEYYVRDINVPIDTIYCVSDTANTIVAAVQGIWSAN